MPTLCASILLTPLYVCMYVCYVSAYAYTQLDTEGLQWLSSSTAFYLILDSLDLASRIAQGVACLCPQPFM